MAKRKTIPKQIREFVRDRQDKRCCCCIEIGTELHHVHPVCTGGINDIDNLVLLCPEHHLAVHLGDLETCLQILEYVYYLLNKELPDDIEKLKELADKIKEDFSVEDDSSNQEPKVESQP